MFLGKWHLQKLDCWQPGWLTSRCVLSTVFYIVYLLVPIIALVHVAGIKWKFCVGLGLGLLFKGTVSRNFRPSWIWSKISIFVITQNDFAKFVNFTNIHICKKFACPHSCWLCVHGVDVIVDYAYTVSTLSLTTQTRCQHSCGLPEHQ